MNLTRHVGIIGLHTALGRFLGYLKDTLVISALGASGIADAFFIATKIASLFRRLFLEGAFNASLVPIFVSLNEKKGLNKAVSFAEQSMTWMMMVIGMLMIYVLSFTDSFVSVIASGFKNDPEKFQWTVEFTRIVFPFILIICMTAVLGSVLNSIHKFVQTAASQTVGNISIIILFFLLQNVFSTKAHGASWAILLSALVQFIWLYMSALKAGIMILPRFPRLTSPVKEFMRRLLPGIFGTGMVQINVLINIYFGSYLKDGGISYLQITERINQLPLSIIGVSLGMVLIPLLTSELQQNNFDKALTTQNKAIQVSLTLSLPIATLAIIFSVPIIATLFMHGKFVHEDVLIASPCLIAFISGLPAYVLLKVFSSTFFALKDTLRPAVAGMLAMMINWVLCNFVVQGLIWPNLQGHVGIATALSISGWVNTLVLSTWAWGMGYFKIDKDLIRSVVKIILITLVMALISLLIYPWVEALSFSMDIWVRILAFISLMLIYIAIYFVSNKLIKVIL